MTECRIGVVGAAGRMGRVLVRLAATTPGFSLAGGSDRPGAAEFGRDLGSLAGVEDQGLALGEDPKAVFAAADAVLDFTVPAATLAEAARHAPIVYAGNMSLGVNLLAELVAHVARALDPAWDIEIIEMHHRHKVDAPSGTALLLGRAAAAGRGARLEDVADRGRDGITGARKSGRIGFAALRGGDVVGEHSVIFATDSERIELTHKATSREIFARGALRAARWAAGRKPGLYGMKDVLGL